MGGRGMPRRKHDHPNVVDMWETGGYSQREFYFRATDKRGHRERTTLSMPPEVFNDAIKAVHRPDLPYSSLQDLVRDAIIHRLHYLGEHGYLDIATKNAIDRLIAKERLANIVLNREHQREAVEQTRDVFTQLREAPKELAEALDEAENVMETLDEPFYSELSTLIDQQRRELSARNGNGN